MSRTTRHRTPNGRLNSYAIYNKKYNYKNSYENFVRSFIRDGNSVFYYSGSKKFRKTLNKSLRAKHRQELIKAFQYNLLDILNTGKLIHNAHFLY